MRRTLGYAFLLVNVLLSFQMIFEAHRFFYDIFALMQLRLATMEVLTKFFIVGLAVGIIAMIFYFENCYRAASEESLKQLVRRFFVFAGIQLLLIALFQSPFFFIVGHRMGWSQDLRYLLKVVGGCLLILLSASLKTKHSS